MDKPTQSSQTPNTPIEEKLSPPSLPPLPQVPSSSPDRFGISLSLSVVLLIISFLGGLLLATLYFQNQFKTTPMPTGTPESSITVAPPKKLIIGTDPTLQPMEYTENGTLVGYDIDLSNFLAKELGTEVEFKTIVFDDLFLALENEQIDMIISAVTITPERQQKYNFSDQYLNAGQVIITRRDNGGIISTADLRGKKIAVQKGTTNETEAIKYTDNSLVIRYPDFAQATKALVDGEVDVLFTDLPNAKGITVANPTLRISSDPFTNEYYAIVFRKGDPRVKNINEALTSLRVKGILTDLKQKWLD